VHHGLYVNRARIHVVNDGVREAVAQAVFAGDISTGADILGMP
jgi:hypothetical protein